MLSAYEQERLDNIARNNAFLDTIGLGENKPALIPKKKVTKRCHDDADDDEASAEPTRRSKRSKEAMAEELGLAAARE